MAIVHTEQTNIGPVAVDGHTITLVARTRALRLGRGGRSALHVWSRPAHVEVLDADGRHRVVRIHDVERMLVGVIVLAGLGYVLGVRGRRALGKR